jgi:hypothetical protein
VQGNAVYECAFVDFRQESTRPTGINNFIEHAMSVDVHFKVAVSAAAGVINPWNLVLVDTPEGIVHFSPFYQSLADSAYGFKIIIMVDASAYRDGAQWDNMYLPDELLSLHQTVKFILLGDLRGITWKAGTLTPGSYVYWEPDPIGEANIGVVGEVLTKSEVFAALFDVLRSCDAPMWALGLREVWLGKLPEAITRELLIETGIDIVGSGQIGNSEIETWKQIPHLIGKAEISDVIVPGSLLDESFKKTDKEALALESSLGLRKQRGKIDRIAVFPRLQQEAGKKLFSTIEELSIQTSKLVAEVDATDGFERDEQRALKKQGIDVEALPSSGVKSQEIVNEFLESVLAQSQKAIEHGHSVVQFADLLSESAEKVAPRSNDQVQVGFNQIVAKLMDSEAATKKKNEQPPSGPLVKMGVFIAKALQKTWVRYVGLFLYIWVITAGLIEILGDSESKGSAIWPQYISDVTRVSVIVVLAVLLTLLTLAGFLLFNTHQKIHKWGMQHSLSSLKDNVDSLRTELSSIAANDWAMYAGRDKAHRILLSLEKIYDVIKSRIHDGLVARFDDPSSAEVRPDIHNPHVRKNLTSDVQKNAFKHMTELKNIVRWDMASLISECLELHTWHLLGRSHVESVEKAVDDHLEGVIRKYVDDGLHFGLLNEEVSDIPLSHSMRQDLGKKIWEEPGAVEQAIRDVVLMPSPAEIITFTTEAQVILFTADEDGSKEIRFFPNIALAALVAVQKLVGTSPVVISTSSVSSAGILRATPLKSNIVKPLSSELTV